MLVEPQFLKSQSKLPNFAEREGRVAVGLQCRTNVAAKGVGSVGNQLSNARGRKGPDSREPRGQGLGKSGNFRRDRESSRQRWLSPFQKAPKHCIRGIESAHACVRHGCPLAVRGERHICCARLRPIPAWYRKGHRVVAYKECVDLRFNLPK